MNVILAETLKTLFDRRAARGGTEPAVLDARREAFADQFDRVREDIIDTLRTLGLADNMDPNQQFVSGPDHRLILEWGTWLQNSNAHVLLKLRTFEGDGAPVSAVRLTTFDGTVLTERIGGKHTYWLAGIPESGRDLAHFKAGLRNFARSSGKKPCLEASTP